MVRKFKTPGEEFIEGITELFASLETKLNDKYTRVTQKGSLSLLFKLLKEEYYQAAASLLPEVEEQIALFKEDVSETVAHCLEKAVMENLVDYVRKTYPNNEGESEKEVKETVAHCLVRETHPDNENEDESEKEAEEEKEEEKPTEA
jgi:hypothetical protein